MLAIQNANSLLIDEEDDIKKYFYEILNKSVYEWNNGRYYNSSFPTKPTPFYVTFVIEKKYMSSFKEKIASYKIEFKTLEGLSPHDHKWTF